MKKETEKAWKQALYELDVASVLIDKYKYAASAFHSEQAAENALKALYIETFNELYTDHKLYELGRKLQAPKEIFKICSNLTPIYLETRYFDSRADEKMPSEQYDEEMAREIFDSTNEVLRWVAKKLNLKF